MCFKLGVVAILVYTSFVSVKPKSEFHMLALKTKDIGDEVLFSRFKTPGGQSWGDANRLVKVN